MPHLTRLAHTPTSHDPAKLCIEYVNTEPKRQLYEQSHGEQHHEPEFSGATISHRAVARRSITHRRNELQQPISAAESVCVS
jgi:hypothetical protein